MTKWEKARELMGVKGYFDCVEKRLKCLGPILPYLETKEGIKTPLRVGSEIEPGEIFDRMIDLYEQSWDEDDIDEMLALFQSAIGRKLIVSDRDLTCKLLAVLDEFIMQKCRRRAKVSCIKMDLPFTTTPVLSSAQ